MFVAAGIPSPNRRMDELTRLTIALADRYEIEREIGKGGMATVYLARDVRHDRRVAVKLLNPELGAVLGVERFLSEIRVTANLQHPNLLPLFDSGEVDGLLFYVMPFVEGESLRARLARERQLPVDEAVRIAISVCGALDYAHRHGVIHRDLKPENILLNDGQPLVADFGIALAVSNAGGARVTQTGLSLGTPQYMSPEQATGDRVIDGRTDIYSVGAVAYEMFAGEPPHAAATAQGVIAKLMTEEPRPLTVLRRSVPPHVDAAVRHALEKLPADRFATAREFADALQAKGGAWRVPIGATRPRPGVLVAASLGVAALCAVGAIIAWSKLARIEAPQPIRFKLDIPEGQQIVSSPGSSIAISPDGRVIAYTATSAQSPMMYTRRLDELKTTGFPPTERPMDLKFSRDGRWISFVGQNGSISRVPATGGSIGILARPDNWQGTSWSVDGGFVYAVRDAIWRVDSPGSIPRKIISIDSTRRESALFGPFVLPDGRDVMFGALGPNGPNLAVASMSGTNRTTFEFPSVNVLGYMDGWLIYGREGGTINAMQFDQRARRISGEQVSLVDGAMWKDEGGVEASLSATGTLAYIRGDNNSSLAFLDARGANGVQAAEHGPYSNPVWSPDGKKIAVEMASSEAAPHTSWIYDVASKVFSRLTTHGSAIRPAWTADGKRVAFVRDDPRGSTIWAVPADASGPEELFYALPGESLREVTFSADGKYAVLRTDVNSTRATKGDLWALPLQGGSERKAVPIVQTSAQEDMPSLSPDGHWLAYDSDETGRFEIYVRPFPGSGGRVQVSTNGGSAPRWAPDGAHLVYRAPRAFWSATMSTATGSPIVTGRDSLFADPYRRTDTGHQDYDIGRDGRFVVFRGVSDNVDIVVIANWWTEALAKLKSQSKSQ